MTLLHETFPYVFIIQYPFISKNMVWQISYFLFTFQFILLLGGDNH